MYGDLAQRDLLLSRCTFARLASSIAPSQVQRQALATWGQLTLKPVKLQMPEMTARRKNRIDLAAYDGVAPPNAKSVWTEGRRTLSGAHASRLLLWFNPYFALAAATPSRMHERSTWATEGEAMEWAAQGVLHTCDVMSGTRIQSHRSFEQQHPTLDEVHAASLSSLRD